MTQNLNEGGDIVTAIGTPCWTRAARVAARRSGRAWMALLVAGVLVPGLAGCAALGLGAAPSASPTTRTPTPPTVTSGVNPPRTPSPALTLTAGTPWMKIISSLIGYTQWLLANPDPDPTLVSNVTAAGCQANDMIAGQVSALAGAGTLVSPVAPLVTSITVPASIAASTVSPSGAGSLTEVTLQVRSVRGTEQILGAGGEVVGHVPELPPTTFEVYLVLGADSKWRLCRVAPADAPSGGRSQAALTTIW